MTEDSRAADLAQAEAEIAEAEAAAAAARARADALRLRQTDDAEPDDAQSDAAEPADEQSPAPAGDDTGTDTVENADDAPADTGLSPEATGWRHRLLVRPRWTTVGVAVAVLAICVSAGFSGYFVMHHRAVADRQHRTAEYAAAARQGIITLMSLQFKSAKEDVQRVIDNSTGEFKDNFEESADDFVKVLEQSKVDTETEVKVTAVQSMTDDSAVVLVAATTKITNVAGAKQDPRPWRLAVTVTRDGEQLKMSKVEFVV